MPYCSRCGVEVDGHVERCPLCSAPIQHLEESAPGEARYPVDELNPKPLMSERMRRRILWEVLTLAYAIAVIVCIGSDLRVDGKLDWSLYPALSIALAWVYSTLAIYFRRQPATIGVVVTISTIAYLAAIDLVDGSFEWFFSLGLPIFALFASVAGVLALVIIKARERGLNVVAFIMIGAALFCLGVDLLVSLYLNGTVDLTWSLVVVLTLVPMAIIFLFLHYRLRNRFDLKRVFHM